MNNAQMDILASEHMLQTPALLINLDYIVETYQQFVVEFPDASVFYAMKANGSPTVVNHLVQHGAGLEIASEPELDLALDAGLSGEQIICSNPIKSASFIQRMNDSGVFAMVADSSYELQKIAVYAPGARIYIRLSVDNTGSVLPLAGKFGVDHEQALNLMMQARELGLQFIGFSFHVGSQCLSPANWYNAIKSCSELWRLALERDFTPLFLNIGGGFPAGHYRDHSIPSLHEIADAVYGAITAFMPGQPEILALEPGRGLVGEAGRLITTIMGEATRGRETWLYLDAGVFNGLMETFEGFPPVVEMIPMISNGNRPLNAYTLAGPSCGPSCDSCDVIAREVAMHAVHPGDRLMFMDAGAYTNEYASRFNGFSIPEVHYLQQPVPVF